jgi:hypothetical protein
MKRERVENVENVENVEEWETPDFFAPVRHIQPAPTAPQVPTVPFRDISNRNQQKRGELPVLQPRQPGRPVGIINRPVASSSRSRPLETKPSSRQMISQALLKTKEPSENNRQRFALINFISNNSFKPLYCDFDYIHSIRPVKKNSASDTSVFFASVMPYRNNNVAVKVKYTLSPDQLAKDNSLPIEHVNYRLMNHVILNDWSPHVLAYVASFGCRSDDLKKLEPPTVRDGIIADLNAPLIKRAERRIATAEKQISEYRGRLGSQNEKEMFKWQAYRDEYATELRRLREPTEQRVDFLITEKAEQATTLAEWLNGYPDADEIKSVFFQILYTFEVFNRIGFRHNDAHEENIFIEKREGASGQYEIDGVKFFVPTSNFVKIFDFDRSAMNCDKSNIHPDYSGLIDEYQRLLQEEGILNTASKYSSRVCDNTLLTNEFCAIVGECNTINKKYDTFLTFWSIHLSLVYNHIKRLEREIKEKSYLKTFATYMTGKAEKQKESLETAKYFNDWIELHLRGAAKHRTKKKDEDGVFNIDPNSIWLVDNPDHPKRDYVPNDYEMSSTLEMLFDPLFDKFKVPREAQGSYIMPKPKWL